MTDKPRARYKVGDKVQMQSGGTVKLEEWWR